MDVNKIRSKVKMSNQSLFVNGGMIYEYQHCNRTS